jgi:hypothetical protein
MTTKATKQTAGNGALPTVDYERLMALSSANVEALMKASEAMLKGLTRLNEELVSFTNAQLKGQVESSREIAQCGSWSEAFEKQMSMARSATEQYLSEAGKLAGLASEMTMASWAPLQSCFQSGLGETARPEKKAQ